MGQLQRTDAAAAAPDRHAHTTPRGSHSESRDEVSSLVVVGAGGRPLHRRAHAVLVVLADEDARQLPQSRHVEGLKELALTDRTHKSLRQNFYSWLEVSFDSF